MSCFPRDCSPFYIPVSKHRKCLRLCWLCDFASLILSTVTDTSSKLGQRLCGQWPQNARTLQLRLSWMLLWVLVWHPQTTPSQKAEQSPTTSDLSCRSCGLDAACILFYGSNILVSDELACRGEGLYLFCVSEIRGLTPYCTDCVSFTNTPHAHPVHARLLPLRKARALAGQLLGKV